MSVFMCVVSASIWKQRSTPSRALLCLEAGTSASRVHGLRICPESLQKPYRYTQPWQSLASQTAKQSVAVSGVLVLRNKRRFAKL